ncbi:hypothetical protein IGK51_001553 [Enterococcus sp. DIV0098]
MFNYDTAMADPDSHVFTNTSESSTSEKEVSDKWN